MDDRILIHPDNCMLSSSGSNDFSLYGAQPDPASSRDSAADPAAADIPQEGQSAAARAPDAQDAPPAPAAAPLETSPDALPLGSFAAPQPAALVAAPAPAPFAEGTSSTGSLTPQAAAPPLAPARAQATAPVAPAQADAAPAGAVISVIAPAAAPEALAASPTAAVAEATPALAETLQAAPAAVEAAAETVSSTVGAAQPLLEAVPLAPAQAAVADVVAMVAPAESVDPVEDGVQDLLGSDPAGGIATLVSLVSVSDVLDVREAGSEPAPAGGDPLVQFIDTLAADPAPDADPDDDDAADTLLAMPGAAVPDTDDLLG